MLADDGIALDAQQYVDDYIMMNAATSPSRALKTVLKRGKQALKETKELTLTASRTGLLNLHARQLIYHFEDHKRKFPVFRPARTLNEAYEIMAGATNNSVQVGGFATFDFPAPLSAPFFFSLAPFCRRCLNRESQGGQPSMCATDPSMGSSRK